MPEQSDKLIPLYTPCQIAAKIYTLITTPYQDLIHLQIVQDNPKATSFSHISRIMVNSANNKYNATVYNSLTRLTKNSYTTMHFTTYKGKQVRRWTITAKGKRLLKSINAAVYL